MKESSHLSLIYLYANYERDTMESWTKPTFQEHSVVFTEKYQ